MRIKKYWTPRYLIDKVRYLIFLKRYPDLPWLTPKAIRWLNTKLTKDKTGLEIGSGRSTFWFASRLKHLTSLEHNYDWYLRIKEEIHSRNVLNVHLSFAAADNELPEKSSYIQLLKNIPAKFDFILVDGILRDYCVEAIMDKLNTKGILIVDDCQRYLPSRSRAPYALRINQPPLTERWQKFSALTAGWDQFRTTDGLRDTCIYIKP